MQIKQRTMELLQKCNTPLGDNITMYSAIIPVMLKNYLNALKNIFFPNLCLSCEKKIENGHLCHSCREKIAFTPLIICKFCASSLNENLINPCKTCSKNPPDYTRIICTTIYKEPIISLIHLFKYKNHQYLAEFLASLMQKHISAIGLNLGSYDFITAVPMHKYKLKTRGYNHARLLAKLLSNYFKIPFKDDIIASTYIKYSQAKLPGNKRKSNVAKAFFVEKDLTNKKIILIDDIFTTGATIQSCSKKLKLKGAEKIIVLTLSKTQSMN